MINANNSLNNQPAGGTFRAALLNAGAVPKSPVVDNGATVLLKALADNCPAHIMLAVRTAPDPDNFAEQIIEVGQAASFIANCPGEHFFTCSTWRGAPSTKADELMALAMACSFATTEEEEFNRRALTKFKIPPNAIIRTDGYLYPLWFLSNRVDLTNAKYQARAERIPTWLVKKTARPDPCAR